jgi:UDP-N-acetylglucosamine acyltransferase
LSIHPSAVVSESAVISRDAIIGPFCVIEGATTVGAHTWLESHVRLGSLHGRVTIGEHNHIQHGAVLGGPPQDLGYRDAPTELVIGDRNRFGEYVSIHIGTQKGGGVTRIGNDNFIMAYTHLGHDCQVEDHVIIANAAQFAGHVSIGAHAYVSGNTSITQYCRIGRFSMLAACATTNKDILPFSIAEGSWARPRACNRVALRRAGLAEEAIREIERAVRIFLDSRLTVVEAAARIAAECRRTEEVEYLLHFIETSQRGIARR